jgi:hypothetical protein
MSHRLKPNPEALSKVFSFSEHVNLGGSFLGPEPSYLAWIEDASYVDIATSHDSYEFDKISQKERDAWRLIHHAIEATTNLLELYKEDRNLFRKIIRQVSFLPCLMSRHPDAERFNRELYEFSEVGRTGLCELSSNPLHLAKQSWPVRYAYAIITTINLTLDTYKPQLKLWAEIYGYGVKHPVSSEEIEAALVKMNCTEEKKKELREKNRGAYRILPAWTQHLERIQQPIKASNVLDYWRKGKEMILEEMPDFHLRPEWDDYRNKRAYQTGRKKGAIQHAIFKDILTALKTIAGSNHRRFAPKTVTK